MIIIGIVTIVLEFLAAVLSLPKLFSKRSHTVVPKVFHRAKGFERLLGTESSAPAPEQV